MGGLLSRDEKRFTTMSAIMKYLVGLIIGIVLMAAWPQKTSLILNNVLENIEMGIEKVRRQMGEDKSNLGSNVGLIIGMTLLSQPSHASFFPSLFLGMMNQDAYMPQAYSDIDTSVKDSPQQNIQPYARQQETFSVKQKRYVFGKGKMPSPSNDVIENE